jgi:hypothetical protein
MTYKPTTTTTSPTLFGTALIFRQRAGRLTAQKQRVSHATPAIAAAIAGSWVTHHHLLSRRVSSLTHHDDTVVAKTW